MPGGDASGPLGHDLVEVSETLMRAGGVDAMFVMRCCAARVRAAHAEQPESEADQGKEHGLEAQRIGDGSGDQRFRQSMSFAVSKNAKASAN